MNLVVLEVAGILSTLTGINVPTILRGWKKEKNGGRYGVNLLGLFQTLASSSDPLIGRWTLGQWNYLVGRKGDGSGVGLPSGKNVIKGGLSIYFKYPEEDRWKGLMSLEYKTSNKWISKFPKHVRQAMKSQFSGAYAVELRGDGHNKYSGTSRIVWREPAVDVEHTGKFSDLQISGSELRGTFENHSKNQMGAASIADPVIFVQRESWAEILTGIY